MTSTQPPFTLNIVTIYRFLGLKTVITGLRAMLRSIADKTAASFLVGVVSTVINIVRVTVGRYFVD